MPYSNKQVLLSVAAALVTAAIAAPVQAQWYGGGPYDGYGYGGYGYGATPASAAAHGYADIVRSAGRYNLETSEAAINVEEARSKNLDNQLKYTETFFEKRRMNKAYRDAERMPRGTREDWVRYAAEAAPERLSASQLNKVQGEMEWPTVLQDDYFATYREEMEKLYREHASAGGGMNSPAYADIQSVGREMEEALADRARDYPAEQYIYAKKFLESLRYEARIES